MEQYKKPIVYIMRINLFREYALPQFGFLVISRTDPFAFPSLSTTSTVLYQQYARSGRGVSWLHTNAFALPAVIQLVGYKHKSHSVIKVYMHFLNVLRKRMHCNRTTGVLRSPGIHISWLIGQGNLSLLIKEFARTQFFNPEKTFFYILSEFLSNKLGNWRPLLARRTGVPYCNVWPVGWLIHRAARRQPLYNWS